MMKSITFLIVTSMIGILSFNAYFINTHSNTFNKPDSEEFAMTYFDEHEDNTLPEVKGLNIDIAETIVGKKGHFDNIFLKITSANNLQVLDIKCNGHVVRAADDGESIEKIDLVGLSFPIEKQKSVIINLKKFINTQLTETGTYTVHVQLSSQNDINGLPQVIDKEIYIRLI
ncbi:hypothetical protein [Flammeovirga kamogawensis]|uniref:Uncharacterized protein n=1 Tax=Flammeovirga kamogawensis TaxID=373891 RepID=A0ABX8GTU8_9BACT|nr:hypothetical protein [Flammeovirga kamogawensis]MBB6463899.1 hypothetical protein [Flammeovirga kamogawensis]QWG06577.1 hypothetical protein KM029_14795 [Flammeovirga kamogawensis]TRX68403.1 hypothetical protein EO216_09795 [Flammeovirga kamogawensis]